MDDTIKNCDYCVFATRVRDNACQHCPNYLTTGAAGYSRTVTTGYVNPSVKTDNYLKVERLQTTQSIILCENCLHNRFVPSEGNRCAYCTRNTCV